MTYYKKWSWPNENPGCGNRAYRAAVPVLTQRAAINAGSQYRSPASEQSQRQEEEIDALRTALDELWAKVAALREKAVAR